MVCLPTCFLRTRNATRSRTRSAAIMDPGPAQPWQCLYVTIVKSCLVSLAFKLSQLTMPKVSIYTRTRIELLQKEGLHPAGIFKVLKREGLSVSFPSVARIVKKLQTIGTLANLPRSGRPSKLSTEAKAFIDQQMRKNDEMTSGQIQKKLEKRGITVSSSTVRRSRKEQGWTLQRTAYCQLIRDANKAKRLEFARHVLESGDTFQNVIFSDECSVSLEQYRRTCYRKIDEPTLHCDISHSAIGIIPMVRNFRSGLENAANLRPLF